MGFEKLDQLPIVTSRQLGAGLGAGAPPLVEFFWSRGAGTRWLVHRAAGRPQAVGVPRGRKACQPTRVTGRRRREGALHVRAPAQALILCIPKPPARSVRQFRLALMRNKRETWGEWAQLIPCLPPTSGLFGLVRL